MYQVGSSKSIAPLLLYMGWLRLVGSLKLYVSFAKEPYNHTHIYVSIDNSVCTHIRARGTRAFAFSSAFIRMVI